MIRRSYHGAQPDRTGGEDAVTVPCATPRGVETFDALTDREKNANPHPEYVTAAQNMCATHLLRDPAAANACLSGAIARGEKWVGIVLGRKVPPPPPDPENERSTAAAGAHEAKRQARLEELRALVARGADVTEACRVLGVTRDGLWKWCDKWGHGDIWRALNPRPATGNQYRKADAIGEISLRRNRPSRAKGVAA